MSIMKKAESLGEEIANSEEYQKLRELERVMYDDPEAKDLLTQMEALQKRIQMLRNNGKEITARQKRELQNLQTKMQNHSKISEYLQAQRRFHQLMNTVNQVITEKLNIDQNNPQTS